MSIAAIIAIGLLSGILLAAGVYALVRKARANRPIIKDEGDLLRLKLWLATR